VEQDEREQIEEHRGPEPEAAECAYVNAEDLFYWMEDDPAADIPLRAIWIDMPTGCRFCC